MSKISVLLPDLRPGGVERMRIVLAKEWLKLGHSVEFVLLKKQGELLGELPTQVSIVDLNVSQFRYSLRSLITYLRNCTPDVFLVAMWPLTCVGIIAAKLSGHKGKIIVSDHTTFKESPQTSSALRRLVFRVSTRLTYPFADARIGVSRGVVEDLSTLSGIKLGRFDVIYNPAAVTCPATSSHLSIKNISGNKIVLGVGTLKPEKDFSTLLRAFSMLPAGLDARLVLLGDGKEKPLLEELAIKLKIAHKVHFAGNVLETSPYYKAASVFVLSSKFEGFANVIVEALSHGVPVVSANCRSGPSEILANGEFGKLVPVGDPKALACAIEETLRRDGERNRKKLIKRALDFSPPLIAKLYLRAMGLDKVSP